MLILPATDIYGGQVVRLLRGDYNKMTVYDADPLVPARRFEAAGAEWLHTVDLEGAKEGTTPNLYVIERLARETSLKVEIGGGIRDIATVDKYMDAGVARVILGTVAVTEPQLVREAAKKYPGRVAVGADLRGNAVAIKGWLEDAPLDRGAFFGSMLDAGVDTFIVTDISRDGAMQGANTALYRELTEEFPEANFIASGGVSSYDDVIALAAIKGVWGAIIGKACYTGDIDVARAVELAR